MNRPPVNKLIYDRELADIEQRTEKGFFQLHDAQRLADWEQYLSDELGLGLDIPQFTFGEDLTRAKFEIIINNAEAIKAASPQADDEPAKPLAIAWDYVKENILEKILAIAWQFYYSENIDKLYSGTFRAGNHVKFRSGLGYFS